MFQSHILHLNNVTHKPILVHFTSRGVAISHPHPHPKSGRATGPPSPGSASLPRDQAPAASWAAPGAWDPAWETSPGRMGWGWDGVGG